MSADDHGAHPGDDAVALISQQPGRPSPQVLAERRERRRGRMFGAISGTAAAVFAVAFVGLTLWSPDGSVDRITLEGTDAAPDAIGIAVITSTGSGLSVNLDIEGLEGAPEGSYYQAWMQGDAGTVAIGTFHARDTANGITLWSGVGEADYPSLIITLQREGDGAGPSSAVVLVGSAAD